MFCCFVVFLFAVCVRWCVGAAFFRLNKVVWCLWFWLLLVVWVVRFVVGLSDTGCYCVWLIWLGGVFVDFFVYCLFGLVVHVIWCEVAPCGLDCVLLVCLRA